MKKILFNQLIKRNHLLIQTTIMNFGNFDLCLFYNLDIEPQDINSTKIKNSINLLEIFKNHDVIINDKENIHLRNMIIDDEFIDSCYVEYYENDYFIRIQFYRINNTELLTSNFITDPKYISLKTAIKRHIELENNILEKYNKYYDLEIENILNVVSEKKFYNLNSIKNLENKLIYPLYDYQKNNINWMIKMEQEPLFDYISSDKLLFLPDGRIYNYGTDEFITNRESIKLRGGIIMDDVGIGKTLQALCLCVNNFKKKTIIIVPEHLLEHWMSQLKKHFNIKKIKNITISCFNSIPNINFNDYDRVIVDEIHEIYSNPEYYKNYFDILCHTNCEYKWGISATPFILNNSIKYLLEYLCEIFLSHPQTDRFKHFYNLYYKIFRKNTKNNIVKEINFPEINENNIFMDFRQTEIILYQSELENKNNNVQALRKYCCDIMINYNKNEEYNITLENFSSVVINENENRCNIELNKLNELIKKKENILKQNDVQNLMYNLEHYNKKITEQEIIYENILRKTNFLKTKINEIINEKVECPICLETIGDGEILSVIECGHIYCHSCLTILLTHIKRCCYCKKPINDNNKVYNIQDKKDILINTSIKIDNLIKIILDKNEKFVLYSQFDDMIDRLILILNNNNINSIKFNDYNDINNFKNNNDIKLLILSSINNASGLDLSFVNNIIIFEPIIGDTLYLKDVEKQIIGRLHRINQIQIVNVYRFIINNTIEEEIFNKSYLIKE